MVYSIYTVQCVKRTDVIRKMELENSKTTHADINKTLRDHTECRCALGKYSSLSFEKAQLCSIIK